MEFSHANQDEWEAKCQVEGNRQSPIDIPKGSAPIKEFPELSLKNQRKTTWCLENTGNFARMSIANEGDQNLLLTGGPLTGEYKFDYFQYHWGKGPGEGSEHSYDGANFEGEIHYQFTLTGEPEEGQDKVAVLCLNMKQAAERKTSMMAVQEKLDQCYEYQAKTEIPNMDFFRIINACFQESDYFTYKGSLTHPPCDENVTYIVFEKPGEFSPEMFNHFRQFKDANGNPIESCHREKRAELGDREISRCKHPRRKKEKKSAPQETPAAEAAPEGGADKPEGEGEKPAEGAEGEGEKPTEGAEGEGEKPAEGEGEKAGEGEEKQAEGEGAEGEAGGEEKKEGEELGEDGGEKAEGDEHGGEGGEEGKKEEGEEDGEKKEEGDEEKAGEEKEGEEGEEKEGEEKEGEEKEGEEGEEKEGEEKEGEEKEGEEKEGEENEGEEEEKKEDEEDDEKKE